MACGGCTLDGMGRAADAEGGAPADPSGGGGSEMISDPPDTASAGGGGAAPEPPPAPDFECVTAASGADLVDGTTKVVASYASQAECQQALAAMGEGVVCAWFVPGMYIGPEGWDETGWRAMNIKTGMGLGRRPHVSLSDCLDASHNARGGVVCTNTGVGYKSAHIETNMWCGASSGLSYCLQASVAARNFHVCSFPSEGDGSGSGWVMTQIDGSTCNYLTSSMPLSECNALVP